MAAAIGIRNINPSFRFKYRSPSSQMISSNPSVSRSIANKRSPQKCLSSSIASHNSVVLSPSSGDFAKEGMDNKTALFAEKIDSWMEESVPDIVKNLHQAPLLIHIYTEEKGVRFKTEKVVFEQWPVVKGEWKSGKSKSPDGLIFVEEIEQNQEYEEGITRAWGLVVQGKGVEYGPACYLLKTNRVGGGLGCFCTHFCLIRVNNFRDSALEQFKDCWLLQ